MEGDNTSECLIYMCDHTIFSYQKDHISQIPVTKGIIWLILTNKILVRVISHLAPSNSGGRARGPQIICALVQQLGGHVLQMASLQRERRLSDVYWFWWEKEINVYFIVTEILACVCYWSMCISYWLTHSSDVSYHFEMHWHAQMVSLPSSSGHYLLYSGKASKLLLILSLKLSPRCWTKPTRPPIFHFCS